MIPVPPATEIAASIYGAWRLARRDPKGLEFFNRTLEGFWRSFFAAVVVAPGYLVIVGLTFVQRPPDAGLGRVVLVMSITYVIKWVAFPVVMYHLAPTFDRQHRYLDFIVAWNWSQVIVILALLPIGLMNFGEVMPEALIGLLWLFVMILLLAYGWYIATVALQINGWLATGLLALYLFLEILIETSTNGMIYLSAASGAS